MSLDNELKQLLDSEPIELNPAQWQRMEAMLDKKKKRRFGFWLLLGAGVSASITAAWLFSYTQQYAPRTAFTAFTIEPVTCESRAENVEIAIMQAPAIAVSQPAHSAAMNEPERIQTAAMQPSIQIPKNIESTRKPTTQANPIETATTTNPNETIDHDQLSDNIAPVATAANTILDLPSDLGLMPWLTFYLPAVNDTPKQMEVAAYKRTKHFYALLGTNSYWQQNFTPLGISAGVGIECPAHRNWRLAVELVAARSHPVDTVHGADATIYGLSSGTSQYVVSALEFYPAALSVSARGRFGRFSLGGGVGASTLISQRLITQHLQTQADWQTNTTVDDGYYRWNRYRVMQPIAQVDAFWVVSEAYEIGTRAALPLTSIDKDGVLKPGQFTLFVKWNIR